MIVGCYTLDLYCDTPDCSHNTRLGWIPDTYTGQTEGQCNKQARADGWKIKRKEGKAYCPDCNKTHNPPKTPEVSL